MERPQDYIKPESNGNVQRLVVKPSFWKFFFWMFAFFTADSYTCETLREGERSVIIWSSGRLIQLLYRTCWEWERVGTHTRKACLPTYHPTTAASLHTRHGCTRLFSGSSLCFLHVNCDVSVFLLLVQNCTKKREEINPDIPRHQHY